MSEVFQSGRHPDADQLSAFAEQALPAHEREATLAHLAVCAECRAVVALSLPLERVPAPAEKPARRVWFRGWYLAWPAAAAIAALVLVLVFVHRVTSKGSGSSQHAEIAIAPPPPAPIAPRPVPQKQASAPVARHLQRAPESGSGLALEREAATSKAFNQALLGAPSAPRMQSAGAGMGAGSASNISKDLLQQPPTMAESRIPQAPPPMAKAQNKVPSGRAPQMATAAAKERLQAPAQANMNELAAGPRPNEIHGAFAEAGSGVTANQAANQLRSPIHPLPSGLPVFSMAEHGRQMLAIDSAHALFLSDDAGAHWRAVAVPWKARAVEVSLVAKSAAVQTGDGFGPGFGAGLGGGMGSGAAMSVGKLRAAQGTASITGTVTDPTGAAIPGALVVISSAADHVSRTAVTDHNGRYSVTGLAEGTYEVKASATGFKIAQVTGVDVSPSRENVENLKLSVGTASETVTVATDSMAEKIPLQRKAQAAPAIPAPAPAVAAPEPVFEIKTEDGSRWTSADGATWKRE